MMLIALASLLAQPLQAVPAEQHRALLDAVQSGCSAVGDHAATLGRLERDGWQAIADDADARIGRLQKAMRAAVAEENGRLTGSQVFRREFGGAAVYLVVTRFESGEGYWAAGCRAYDFEAKAPIDPGLLVAWMGREPSARVVDETGGKLVWEPGWEPVSVEVNFVPADSPAKAMDLSGNIIVAQTIGGF